MRWKLDVSRLSATSKARRLQLGLLQADVAARAGLDPSYIFKLEQGDVVRPGLEVLRSLADALQFRGLDEFLAGCVDAPLGPSPVERIAQQTAAAILAEVRLLLAQPPDDSPPAEPRQVQQLLGDKAEADKAAPLRRLSPRPHAGHSTRRRINPECVGAAV